ncbi:GHKL domain-containing protein [Blautia schinkii]|nr:GHKL domain-containing protein [Blautia schinkii]
MLKNLTEFSSVVLDSGFIVQMLFIALAGVIVLGRMKYKEYTLKRDILTVFLHTILLLSVMLILEAFFFGLFRVGFLLNLRGLNFSLPVLIAYIIYASLFCDFHFWEKCTLVISMFSTVIVMMEWSAPYGMLWLVGSTKINGMIIRLVSNILIVLFACFIHKFSITKYYFTKTEAILNCVESLLVALAAMFHEALSANWNLDVGFVLKLYILGIFLIVYVINVLTYVFSYLIARNRQMLLETQLIKQKQSAELEMAELTAESLEELREIRHDIKNQYFYMKSMLEEKRFEDLNDFFEKFTGKISSQLFTYVDCGNQEISAVINLERLKAERLHVQMNMNVVVPPSLPFESSDICSLVTNLLDNALEECQRTSKEKVINIVINTRDNDYLYLCIVNPTDKADKARAFKSLPTDKENKILHGLGMNIINKIAEKYDGYFNCHINDGKFICEVLLNMSKIHKEKGDSHERSVRSSDL